MSFTWGLPFDEAAEATTAAAPVVNNAQMAAQQKANEQAAKDAEERKAQEEVRKRQLALADQLQTQASGGGPSLAGQMYQQATDQNLKNAMALGASSRGARNPGLINQQVQNAQGVFSQQAAQGAAGARMQEQLNAQGQLGGLLGGTRGQDISQSLGQQGLGQQQSQYAATMAQRQKENEAALAQHESDRWWQLAGGIAGGAAGMATGAAAAPRVGSNTPLPPTAWAGPNTGAEYSSVAAHGAIVPGQAKMPGDHAANDTKPYMLSPGEIIVPRSKAVNADMAKDFIDQLMMVKKSKSDGSEKLAKVLEAHRALHQRVSALEKNRGAA